MGKYIDLDNTIETIDACILANVDNDEVRTMFEFTKGILESTPPADVKEVTRGIWNQKCITATEKTYMCSVCGREIVIPKILQNNIYEVFSYCHCGADMRGKYD